MLMTDPATGKGISVAMWNSDADQKASGDQWLATADAMLVIGQYVIRNHQDHSYRSARC